MATTRVSSDSDDDRLVHFRQALMCPSGGGVPTLRTARFLNHTINSIDDDVFDLPSDAFSSRPEAFEPEKWPVKFSLAGWGTPSLSWVEWVNAMAKSHELSWRKSGIHDAIMASRYHVKKHEVLIMGLVEKWCVDTNTFVFPWGEATITLEDMMVLGGFSAVGNYVLGSIKRDELKSVEKKLKRAKREISKSSGKKCLVDLWMKEFKNSGSEIEHEAFIATWLARFAFPDSVDVIPEKLFSASVHLARGVRLALAPAVLAGIYKDLGLLKEKISAYVHFGDVEEESLVVTSPFQFVQVWAWERIMEVRPRITEVPNALKPGDPRMARWQHHIGVEYYPKLENFRKVLDSAQESFDHRPYTKPVKNLKVPKFYLENDCWVSVDPSLDEEMVSFARCLRFSKLVGVDCVEPYYPHRVAMQFGYDQDLPGIVPAMVETPELAWKDYIRPICDGMLYVPSRLYEADVTYTYTAWWKQSVGILQSTTGKRSTHLRSPQKERENPEVAVSNSPGKLKMAAGKVNEKDKETKGGRIFVNSRIAVKRMKAAGENGVVVLEEVSKQLKGTKEVGSLTGGSEVSMKKSEGVKKPLASTKSPDTPRDNAKNLKGAVKGSRENEATKNNHVKFLLPNSPVRSHKTQPVTPKQNSKNSPVRPAKPVPRTAERKNKEKGKWVRSCLSQRDSRKALAHSPAKAKNDSKNAPGDLDSSNSGIKTTKPQSLKKSDESHFPRGSDKASIGELGEQKEAATEESVKDIQVAVEANASNLLGQMPVLREHVGEEGEAMYQIPKSQFEVMSQAFEEVLMELQTIKSALNIKSVNED